MCGYETLGGQIMIRTLDLGGSSQRGKRWSDSLLKLNLLNVLRLRMEVRTRGIQSDCRVCGLCKQADRLGTARLSIGKGSEVKHNTR